MERTLIIRCCAPKEMYDDGGYCDTKIKRFGIYYWAGVADGNGEKMCSDCMLQTLIHQVITERGEIPEYVDNWLVEFEAITKKEV